MWIVIEGRYSFEAEFGIHEVTKETPQRYYYMKGFGHSRLREEFVDKKKVVAVFPTEEMATVAVNHWVQEFEDAIGEALQEVKNLREKMNGMAIVIAELKKDRRDEIRREGEGTGE